MCFFCKNDELINSTTTHVVNLENCVIVIKNVPCEECSQCGEKFFSDEVVQQLEIIVNEVKIFSTEVYVTDYNRKVA